MRDITLLLLIGVLAAMALPGPRPTVDVRAAEGWVIFDPSKDGYAYRYGPSIILNADGSLDAWFASPGGPGSDGVGQWDWIRHKRSSDGGKTWGPETIVLKATEGSLDRLSVCDPGVVKLGGWYYLGVTAVDNDPGNRNCVFVARSRSPTGPFEKWNGTGWGGAPKPLVEFTTPAEAWGAGEPSFVAKGKTLYIYYTWWVTKNPDGPLLNQTRVATAPADDPDWPAKMTYRGVAWDRVAGEDSADVKYVPALKCFLAVSTASRMSAEAHVVYRTSEDGLKFGSPVKLTETVMPWCHNVGISGTPEGHLDVKARNFIAYAYSAEPKVNWGNWYTRLNPITITALR